MESNYLKVHLSKAAFLLLVADAAVIMLTYYAIELFFHLQLWQGPLEIEMPLIAALAFCSLGQLRGLYGSWRINSSMREAGEVFVIWFIVFSLILTLLFISKNSHNVSRVAVVGWAMLAPVLLVVIRRIQRSLLNRFRSQGYGTRNYAIASANHTAVKLVMQLENLPWTRQVFQGYYDDRRTIARLPEQTHGLLRGDFAELIADVRAGKIDIVYIALPIQAEKKINELVDALADTTATVYFIPDLFTFGLQQASWFNLNGIPLVSIYDTPFNGVFGWVKRIEDIVLASLILVLIAVPMLVIAIGVKLSSPGSVIFKQRRYGLNGDLVYVWKFRSMTVCEDGDRVIQAQKGDNRVTKLGAFLRRTSLDELPQFINVLQGSMSIVGPRPHAVAHNEQYRKLIQGYMLRHKVRPGITGLAQVNGWRGETDSLEKMEKRVEYDLQYIQDWSLGLDIKIILKTILVVLKKDNAY